MKKKAGLNLRMPKGHPLYRPSPLTVEVGRGEVDQKTVIAAAEKAGAEWLVVDRDVCQNSSLESAAISYKWLQDNYL
jgi:hypothetical protein